jgi:hypothetical protein
LEIRRVNTDNEFDMGWEDENPPDVEDLDVSADGQDEDEPATAVGLLNELDDESFLEHLAERDAAQAAELTGEADEPDADETAHLEALGKAARGEDYLPTEAESAEAFRQSKQAAEVEEFREFIREQHQALRDRVAADRALWDRENAPAVEDEAPPPTVFEAMSDDQFSRFLAARDADATSLGGGLTDEELSAAYSRLTATPEDD